jgi:beta-1,4-N-acetylglucosaminyltransferase
MKTAKSQINTFMRIWPSSSDNHEPKRKQKRVLMIASGGGHVDVAVALRPAFEDARVELAAYYHENFKTLPFDKVHLLAILTSRMNLVLAMSLAVNLFQFIYLFIRIRPQIVFSCGAELAIPAMLLARLIPGTRTIHIESAVWVNDLSTTGKILRHLCDHILVQWEPAARKYGGKVCFLGRAF